MSVRRDRTFGYQRSRNTGSPTSRPRMVGLSHLEVDSSVDSGFP